VRRRETFWEGKIFGKKSKRSSLNYVQKNGKESRKRSRLDDFFADKRRGGFFKGKKKSVYIESLMARRFPQLNRGKRPISDTSTYPWAHAEEKRWGKF